MTGWAFFAGMWLGALTVLGILWVLDTEDEVMLNEHGVKLDRNGYAPSILSSFGGCYLCGEQHRPVERHEIYHAAYRQRAKADGLWVCLCTGCHRTGKQAVHRDGARDRALKEQGQRMAMVRYGWTEEQFRERYGKSYLGSGGTVTPPGLRPPLSSEEGKGGFRLTDEEEIG